MKISNVKQDGENGHYWFDPLLIHPEVTQQVLSILRDGSNFQWYILP